MYIETISRKEYLLKDGDTVFGWLRYKKKFLAEADIFIAGSNESINLNVNSILLGGKSFNEKNELVAELHNGIGTSILLKIENKQYYFKKTGWWKIRFTLTNDKNEELIALIPLISWTKKTHDYTLQLNDELSHEITPLLILHTLHCANRGISILNGSITAANM